MGSKPIQKSSKRPPKVRRISAEPPPSVIEDTSTLSRPSKTSLGMETRLISLAYSQAERELLAGTAPAIVVTQLLRMGTETARLERLKLDQERQLMAAKIESMAASAKREEFFQEVLVAMKKYSGSTRISARDDEEL